MRSANGQIVRRAPQTGVERDRGDDERPPRDGAVLLRDARDEVGILVEERYGMPA